MSAILALHPHSFSFITFVQHLLFDSIADAGGYYASRFCNHWYHKVPIAVGFALVTTFALVSLIG